jgi:galactonate dehydratase
MKISNISAHIMGVPGPGGAGPARNWVFVRIETDNGITGLGEATTEYHEQAVAAMIEHHFAEVLVGQDPTRVQHLWQLMQRSFWWRCGVTACSAMSGIEQALWDITGKAYGQPVYKLLGGAVRDRIRLYARGDLGLNSPRAELDAAMTEGFTAFKFGPGAMATFDELAALERTVAVGAELRAAAGSGFDLMADCAGIFSPTGAARLVERLRAVRPLFVEEPLNMDTPRGLVELRRAFPGVPIAAGERVLTRWGFREWLESAAVDVIQADVCHCGGIGELLRIAAGAEVYNVGVAPHNPYGPVALAANLHACAAMPNFLILEHCRLRPWFDEVQVYGPVVRQGCVEINDRPGLGIDLDWNYVNANPPVALPPRVLLDRWGGMPSL